MSRAARAGGARSNARGVTYALHLTYQRRELPLRQPIRIEVEHVHAWQPPRAGGVGARGRCERRPWKSSAHSVRTNPGQQRGRGAFSTATATSRVEVAATEQETPVVNTMEKNNPNPEPAVRNRTRRL